MSDHGTKRRSALEHIYDVIELSSHGEQVLALIGIDRANHLRVLTPDQFQKKLDNEGLTGLGDQMTILAFVAWYQR